MTRSKLDPHLLDDIARVAGGAVNIVSGIQQQIREDMRSRMDDIAHKADLVAREDLDRAEAMISKLRSKLEILEERVCVLEGSKKAPAVKKKSATSAPKKKNTTAKGKKTKK